MFQGIPASTGSKDASCTARAAPQECPNSTRGLAGSAVGGHSPLRVSFLSITSDLSMTNSCLVMASNSTYSPFYIGDSEANLSGWQTRNFCRGQRFNTSSAIVLRLRVLRLKRPSATRIRQAYGEFLADNGMYVTCIIFMITLYMAPPKRSGMEVIHSTWLKCNISLVSPHPTLAESLDAKGR